MTKCLELDSGSFRRTGENTVETVSENNLIRRVVVFARLLLFGQRKAIFISES